jgi:predicted acyl esterase
MPDVLHTFLKGHRIVVQIQSTWFPLIDANPQTFVDIYHAPLPISERVSNESIAPLIIRSSLKNHPQPLAKPRASLSRGHSHGIVGRSVDLGF